MDAVNNKRPINLDLTTIRQPITAIISILHRISGAGLFLIIPFLLYFFEKSTSGLKGFVDVQNTLSSAGFKFFFWLILIGITYHFMAGIRHLLMDLKIGEGKESGRTGAGWVIILTIIVSLGLGFWLW